jgi:hypothetical protein
MHEVRNFFEFDDFDSLNETARNLEYKDIENPADGVTYPGISDEVPAQVKKYIEEKCSNLWMRNLEAKTIFFRLTHTGTETAPHQAHTDTAMGKYTFICYFQDAPEEHPDAGTSLLKHGTVGGLHTDPWTRGEQDVWQRDTNKYDSWDITRLFKMRRNTAVTYESKRMHRAEPVGGFGRDVSDGRLVLVAFLEPRNG